MRKNQNNFAFIDSQNLNLSIRNQGWELDFAKFYTFLRHKFFISKAFIFIGYIAKNENLYSILRAMGYHLIFKPTVDAAGKTKGNVDAELVLHTMIEYQNYDKAVIASGDGDFYCLVKYLQQKNKLEKLVIPNKYMYSSLLREFTTSNKTCFLNHEQEKLEHKKRKA